METFTSVEHIAKLGLASLKEKGVFWYGMPRPLQHAVQNMLQKQLGRNIIVLTFAPWTEFVFLDTAIEIKDFSWLAPHSQLRYELQYEQGILESALPLLPNGLFSLDEIPYAIVNEALCHE